MGNEIILQYHYPDFKAAGTSALAEEIFNTYKVFPRVVKNPLERFSSGI